MLGRGGPWLLRFREGVFVASNEANNRTCVPYVRVSPEIRTLSGLVQCWARSLGSEFAFSG